MRLASKAFVGRWPAHGVAVACWLLVKGSVQTPFKQLLPLLLLLQPSMIRELRSRCCVGDITMSSAVVEGQCSEQAVRVTGRAVVGAAAIEKALLQHWGSR